MGAFEAITSVTVLIRQEGETFYAHSPDVLGLHVCGANETELNNRITSGIELLYKLNHKKIVKARLAADKETFSETPMRSANNFLVRMAT